MQNQLSTTEKSTNHHSVSNHRNRTFGNLLNIFDMPHNFMLHEMEPKIEVSENKKNVMVTAELPGINEQDIDLEISANGYLTINCEKRHENTEISQDNYFSEISYGHISRTIPLPWDLEYTKASAEYDNGVLTINIPKTTQEQSKKQKITVSKSKKSSSTKK